MHQPQLYTHFIHPIKLNSKLKLGTRPQPQTTYNS